MKIVKREFYYKIRYLLNRSKVCKKSLFRPTFYYKIKNMLNCNNSKEIYEKNIIDPEFYQRIYYLLNRNNKCKYLEKKIKKPKPLNKPRKLKKEKFSTLEPLIIEDNSIKLKFD